MRNQRTHRQLALIALLISLFASLGCDAVVGRLVDRAAERQMNSTDLGLLEDDALNVFLCGTGSPLPDPIRAAACTIVVAGGKLYVVDVGPGSQEVAQVAGIPTSALAGPHDPTRNLRRGVDERHDLQPELLPRADR